MFERYYPYNDKRYSMLIKGAPDKFTFLYWYQGDDILMDMGNLDQTTITVPKHNKTW